jgi:hypothetical protein
MPENRRRRRFGILGRPSSAGVENLLEGGVPIVGRLTLLGSLIDDTTLNRPFRYRNRNVINTNSGARMQPLYSR